MVDNIFLLFFRHFNFYPGNDKISDDAEQPEWIKEAKSDKRKLKHALKRVHTKTEKLDDKLARLVDYLDSMSMETGNSIELETNSISMETGNGIE